MVKLLSTDPPVYLASLNNGQL